MSTFLALDGGGTKTEMLLTDRDGHLLAHAMGAGCNPNRLTDEALRRTFQESIALVTASRPGAVRDMAVVFAGVAGASHPGNNARVQAALSAALPCSPAVRVAGDMVSALWSGTRGSPGIALIAGTGATAYGEEAGGRGHRAGGWGYLIGDDGSGYALGREAVREICRFVDGSGEPTTLWDRLAAAHGLSIPLDLVPFVYGQERPPFDKLVPLVLDAWREGDRGAREAVARIVADQTALVGAVYRALDLAGRPFTLVLRGGLLTAGGVIRPLLLEALRTSLAGARYDVDGTDAPPVYGSALLALREGGCLTEAVADTLLEGMREAGLCRDDARRA